LGNLWKQILCFYGPTFCKLVLRSSVSHCFLKTNLLLTMKWSFLIWGMSDDG
jgi:hypothetical protein